MTDAPDVKRINERARADILDVLPYLDDEDLDAIIEAGWTFAATRGLYGCEWSPIVAGIQTWGYPEPLPHLGSETLGPEGSHPPLCGQNDGF